MEWLIGRYKPDMLWIADDVFTINHGWLERWRQELSRRKIHIPFECISRADRLNEEVIRTLAELGCFRLWIGSESGSQRILDLMQRGVQVRAVRDANALCRQFGIRSGMFLMWGYEGEEIEDIEQTIEHVRLSLPDIFLTTVSYPIKGTPYYKKVASRLVEIKPWGESSDRDLEIAGRRPRNFYRVADELLRFEMELERTRASLHRNEVPPARIGELEALIAERRQTLHAWSTVEEQPA